MRVHFLTQTKLIEILIQEQESVAFLTWDGSRTTNPVQQFARNCLGLRIAISLLLAEHMPDGDQQFPGHSNNRLLFANTSAQGNLARSCLTLVCNISWNKNLDGLEKSLRNT